MAFVLRLSVVFKQPIVLVLGHPRGFLLICIGGFSLPAVPFSIGFVLRDASTALFSATCQLPKSMRPGESGRRRGHYGPAGSEGLC